MSYLNTLYVKPNWLSLMKPRAFFYKDFLMQSSYKFAFVTQIAGIIFSASVWFFLSELFGQAVSPYLEQFGGDYFSFVLIGVAFSSYMSVSLSSFSDNIRSAQTLGTLEAMLVTQTRIPVILISSSIYSFVLTSFRVVIFLLFGALFLNLNIESANYVAALLVLGITIICFGTIGIFSASFIIVLKKGDPFRWIFINLSMLLGGVYYPTSVLPEWLKAISAFLPITYSLKGMRLALIQGLDTISIISHMAPLIIGTIILFPLSIMGFQAAVNWAKMEGSLMKY